MIKVIQSTSFDFGMPALSLMDVHSRGIDKSWMQKRATSELVAIAKSLRPDPDFANLHLISLGAQEAYGCNRNGDGFNEKAGKYKLGNGGTYDMADGLVTYHKTFTKHAHVFRHHKNDDPKYATGEVYAEYYNPIMKRGELIIKVPLKEFGWDQKIQKLAEGKDIPFSMACKVAYDVCTECGNKSPSREKYCEHLKDHLTEVTKSGHQYFAINDKPTFFDISEVIRPADRIAYSLYKAANVNIVGGAELAEQLGLTLPSRMIMATTKLANSKLAVARKLAEIEKEIEAMAHGKDALSPIKGLLSASPCGNIPSDELDKLKGVDLNGVMRVLADAKICLSLRDFLQLVLGDKFNAVAGGTPAVEEMLPGIFSRLMEDGSAEECASDSAYDPGNIAVPREVKEIIGKLAGGHSLATGPAKTRMQITIIRGITPRLPGPMSLKHASAAPASAAHVAREYAKYQLSFAHAAQGDNLTNGLTIIRNYLRG
jgi:hypothetical protein